MPDDNGKIKGFTPTRKTAEAWERIFGCSLCKIPGAPPHEASRRCQSGRRPHCACDTCF